MNSLRFKILALAVSLVLLTQVGMIAAVLNRANTQVSDSADTLLQKASMVLDNFAAGRGLRLHGIGSALASSAELKAAVAARDSAAISAELLKQQRRAQLAISFLVAADGTVIGGRRPASWPNEAAPSVLRRALVEGYARSILDVDGTLFEIGVLPVADGAGWLVVGDELDTSVVRRLSAVAGTTVSIAGTDVTGRPILLSALPVSTAQLLVERLTEAGVEAGRPGRVRVNGNDYLGLIMPFGRSITGVQVVLTESLDRAMAPFDELRQQVLVLGTLALLAAICGAWWIARSISRPAEQLVVAARRISEGDYTRPVPTFSGEAGELAQAMNTMRASIAEREARISYLAGFDSLTGLPARSAAIEHLEALLREPPDDAPITLLVLEVADFAEMASSLGTDISEALLCQAAERLRSGLDSRQMLCRLDGGQFLIILAATGIDAAKELADDLHRLLTAGLSVREVNVAVDPHTGLCSWPAHGTDAQALVQRASMALHEARRSGRAVAVYEAGREERHARQLGILADLRRATRHDELRLYVQPKLRLADNQICGAEALVRWQHPTLGFLPPDQFIPIAETSGNISLITQWALSTAIRECRLWVEDGIDMPVAVNISGRDLQNSRLPVLVVELLRDHDLDPRYLMLEITEQAVVHDMAHATGVLNCLRELGVRISVDDFGTGYSSLSQLRRLPVDELKIDRSFVRELPDNRGDAVIVRATIGLAHDLGLEVLAEGVETRQALAWLREQHCERAQGFLISKPMPVESFAGWLKTWGTDPTRSTLTAARVD